MNQKYIVRLADQERDELAANWTRRLLARMMVELEIVEPVSYETVKGTRFGLKGCATGVMVIATAGIASPVNVMTHKRVSFKVRSLMLAVAVAALCFGAERMWRRRQFYLEQAVPHAHMEAHYSDLALDLAGVERQPPSRVANALYLFPNGKAVKFVTHGPSPRIYYPLESTNLADDATVAQLIDMCKKGAAKEGAIRRMFERMAARPWSLSNPAPSSD